jgi:LmbE family N-acetylglucosaminyl deacetylase
MKSLEKRVLVIAAHPDDEVLGCGATIAKETANGSDVRIVIMQDGVTVRYKRMSAKVKRELNQLYRSSHDAAQILGVPKENVLFGKFPCAGINTVPFGKLRQYLTDIVQSFKPDVVYTHHHGDYNPDHTIVHQAAVYTSRPNPGEHTPREVYTFEVASSTERADQSNNPFQPNVYVDVRATIDRKLKAMDAYPENEAPAYPHPRNPAALRILAQKRGIDAGMHYAEAFHLVRSIRK